MGTTPTPAEIVVERPLAVSLPEAWRWVTRPALISRWLTACTSRRGGAGYRLTFAEDTGPHVKTALWRGGYRSPDARGYTVLLRDPGYRDSVVHLEVAASGPTSVVRLTHRCAAPELDEGYRSGWAGYLDRLAVVSAGPSGRPS
jgi:hypothetical protein